MELNNTVDPAYVKNEVHMLVSNKFLKGLMLYNIVLYTVMFSVYMLMDFDAHFKLPDHTDRATPFTIAYYTLLCQTQVMAGEIEPKTKLARMLLMIHIFFSWFVVALIMVPWAAT